MVAHIIRTLSSLDTANLSRIACVIILVLDFRAGHGQHFRRGTETIDLGERGVGEDCVGNC